MSGIDLPREPTPDMRIAGGIAWAEASATAETYVDNADACWKAMYDVWVAAQNTAHPAVSSTNGDHATLGEG